MEMRVEMGEKDAVSALTLSNNCNVVADQRSPNASVHRVGSARYGPV